MLHCSLPSLSPFLLLLFYIERPVRFDWWSSEQSTALPLQSNRNSQLNCFLFAFQIFKLIFCSFANKIKIKNIISFAVKEKEEGEERLKSVRLRMTKRTSHKKDITDKEEEEEDQRSKTKRRRRRQTKKTETIHKTLDRK